MRGIVLLAASLSCIGQLTAQDLRLKTKPAREAGIHLSDPSRRLAASRYHLVIQFADTPMDGQLTGLTDRGVKVLSYVPDYGFAASADDGASFEGLGLEWAGQLVADDKISPDYSGSRMAVVEFYSDVAPGDARSIVMDAQLRIQEHSGLLPNHLLVEASLDEVRLLAEWDEIAYVFPASDDLMQGVPVVACAGALTTQGLVGQSVARFGEGWDGPGLGSTDLNYGFVAVTPKLAADAVRSEFARALAEWSKYVALNFHLADRTDGDRTLAVLFASGAHGDAYPFDGPGGTIAHTFYPFPLNSEPIAGDLHFDADESWRIGADVDFFSVALHESGHALGLGHSDQPGAVMYPYYRRHSALTQEDIGAIQELYAARDSAPAPLALTVRDPVSPTAATTTDLSGTASGGQGNVIVFWTTDQGLAGSAQGVSSWVASGIPLNPGFNAITVIARDGGGIQVRQTVTVLRQIAAIMTLQILAPTSAAFYTTSVGTLGLSGTASDVSGVGHVTWSNSRGGAGVGSGGNNWSVGPVALFAGQNAIAITAFALSGASVIRTLQVGYTPAALGPDTTAPSITILIPALTSVATSSATITIIGTASDDTAVAQVTWANSNGGGSIANGTGNWTAGPVPLLVGSNTITIRATDPAGNMAWRALTVTRR